MSSLRPTTRDERDQTVDLLRGVALLGTFYMSAVAYGLPHAAYFNLRSPDDNSTLDWAAALVGEILFDQKAIALLALLYGAGITYLTDRAAAQNVRSRWIVLRRAAALFALGFPVGMHGLLWEGTPLWFFAFFTPVLYWLRKRSDRVLLGFGAIGMALATLAALEFHPITDEERATLGQYWVTGSHELNDVAGSYMFLSTVFLLTSLMTIGLFIGRRGLLHSNGVVHADRMIRYGLGLGLPLAIATLIWREVGDYEPEVAILAEAPNTLSIIPLTLGFAGLIMKWASSHRAMWLRDRLQAAGQMALTNSIVQTGFGIFLVREYGFGRGTLGRSELVLVVLAMWAFQLGLSKPTLDRFGHGPFERAVRWFSYGKQR